MLYAAIPALLKIRFGANEILTSLMLVYVAQLLVDYLARGPWRNPEGFNFPDSRRFTDGQVLPILLGANVHVEHRLRHRRGARRRLSAAPHASPASRSG